MTKPIETIDDLAKIAGAELGQERSQSKKSEVVVEEIKIKSHPNYEYHQANSNLWHWYYNSYPTNEGIHFSFTTIGFALQFMRRFKTWAVETIIDSTGRDWYVVKNNDQTEPTEKQYTWLREYNSDVGPVTFEEYQRGYKFWEGKKDVKGRTLWYVSSKDYKNGRGYYTAGANKEAAMWELRRSFDTKRARGDL